MIKVEIRLHSRTCTIDGYIDESTSSVEFFKMSCTPQVRVGAIVEFYLYTNSRGHT